MIKYKLECKNCKIIFDSWFASSKEYEKLKKKKLLICHICNSLKVEKTLMSPNISTFKNTLELTSKDEKYKKAKKKIFEYQKFIENNFNYVGENFAYEARSIHYKTKKTSKGIYGVASKEDFKELKEEGIDAEEIPWIKNSTN